MRIDWRHILVAAGLLALSLFILFPKWTVDDAFISFRYGHNLAEYGELVYNPGQPPVEGYTGVLLPLLAALWTWLSLPLVLMSHLTGMAGWLWTARGIWRLSRLSGYSRETAATALLLFAAYPFMYTHALGGLETLLFAGALLESLVWLRAYLEAPAHGRGAALGLSLLLACLIRPDGAALVLVTAVAVLTAGKAQRGKPALTALTLYLLPAAGYILFKTSYYGSLLPNTWYAKAYEGLLNPEAVIAFVRWGARYFGLILLPAAMLLWRFLGLRQSLREKLRGHHARLWLSMLLFVLLYTAAYSRSHLYMNYSYRFMAPLTPLLLVLCLPLLDALRRALSELNVKQKPLLQGLVGSFALLQALNMGLNLRDELYFTGYYRHIMEEEYLPAAEVLKEVLPEDAKIAVYLDAGAVPYYSGFETVDMGRLNDAYLARERPTQEAVVDYFFAQNPHALVITSDNADSLHYIPEAMAISKDPRFRRFALGVRFGNSAGFPYFQFVYFNTRRVAYRPL